VVRRKRSRAYEDLLPYLSLAELDLSQGKPAEALKFILEARNRFREQPHLDWLLGRAYMDGGQYEEAVGAFEPLLVPHLLTRTFHHYGYDPRMFSAWPHEAIATCHFQLGRYAEAARHYAAALEGDPEVRENEVKRVLCTRLAAERG
jgi:tetratricopeptide (TPR) repeat protein